MRIVWVSRVTGPNKNHRKYIESLGSDLQQIDWDDNAGFLKRYLGWIKLAWNFPNRKKYDWFISIDVKFPVILLRMLRRISSRQKLVCFHATETLYFMHAGRYPARTQLAFKRALLKYDAHICVSQMSAELLREVTGGKARHVHTIFNGVTKERLAKYRPLTPALSGNNILFIGNLYSGWRHWYKGIDLMFAAFKTAQQKHPDLKLIIVGSVEKSVMDQIQKEYSAAFLHHVAFAGASDELEKYFADSALYLHCARGEAFGVSVIEAMTAGLPVLVSEWTGAKEVVNRAGKELVFALDPDEIASKITAYFNSSLDERMRISQACREAVKNNTQENAIVRLKECIAELEKEFKGA